VRVLLAMRQMVILTAGPDQRVLLPAYKCAQTMLQLYLVPVRCCCGGGSINEAGADDDNLDGGAEKVVMVADGTTSSTAQYGIGGRRSIFTLMRRLPSET
jgi:hypothetical protein